MDTQQIVVKPLPPVGYEDRHHWLHPDMANPRELGRLKIPGYIGATIKYEGFLALVRDFVGTTGARRVDCPDQGGWYRVKRGFLRRNEDEIEALVKRVEGQDIEEQALELSVKRGKHYIYLFFAPYHDEVACYYVSVPVPCLDRVGAEGFDGDISPVDGRDRRIVAIWDPADYYLRHSRFRKVDQAGRKGH